jgi:hypothetical protein
MFLPLVRHLRLLQNTSARASVGPASGRRLAGEDQLGRCAAERCTYYRLYLPAAVASVPFGFVLVRVRVRLYRHCLCRGKLTLTAMYLRRVRVAGCRGGRATADACFDRCYAACACGIKPRRGTPAALQGAVVWWYAWGDGAHCPSASRHAAKRPNGQTFTGPVRCSKFCVDYKPRNLEGGGRDVPRTRH